jgi:uncharacterized membrane protein
MTDRNAPVCEPPIFSAVLTPNCSLGGYAFAIVMGLAAVLLLSSGIAFLVLGAWPVFGFCGLDLLLLFLAFRANYRAARACEEVTVTPSVLTVRKIGPGGDVHEWSANPVWVQIDREVHAEFGVQRLALVTRGRVFPIASFLGPDEKASFASALSAAIREAKRGPTRTRFEGA